MAGVLLFLFRLPTCVKRFLRTSVRKGFNSQIMRHESFAVLIGASRRLCSLRISGAIVVKQRPAGLWVGCYA